MRSVNKRQANNHWLELTRVIVLVERMNIYLSVDLPYYDLIEASCLLIY